MTIATIESLDREGRGVTHVEGKAIFVDGALPGEIVEYSPYKKKGSYELAQLVRIRLPRDTQLIPEISANKYALNIRFTVLGADRARGCDMDVEFELTFCNL